MEITNEVRESHKRLSQCSARFIDYVEKNPGVVERSIYKEVYGVHFDLVAPQPWPAFIDSRMRRELEDAGREVFNLIKSVPERVFDNDVQAISDYLREPPDRVEVQLNGVTPDHLKGILGRGDFIFTPSGLKCLEYNVTASVGGWSIAFMEPVYLKEPSISEFLRECGAKVRNKNLMVVFFEHILRDAVNKYPDAAEINVAVAISSYGKHSEDVLHDIQLERLFQETMRLNHSHLKGGIFFGDYQHLDVVDNTLFFKENKIDVLVEMYLGDVPLEIMDVFKAGNILLYDGPIAPLLANKLMLAVLSEHEDSDLYSPGEREIIKKYIPWTRKAVPGDVTYRSEQFDMEEFLLSAREKLVLKPADGLGGESVCVGKYTSPLLWKEMVKVAFRNKNWLAQEFVSSLPFLYQTAPTGCCGHDVVWGVFIFGESYAGTFLRVLPREKNTKGVINSHMGAEYSVVFEVEE